MRIVRFSTPSPQPFNFQDQKISLSKLSQVKAHSNVQYTQQKQPFINNSTQKQYQSNIKQPHYQQSHIKWVPDPLVTDVILNEVKNLIQPQQQISTQKKVVRRKIFQDQSQLSKQNVQIPTFTHMPSMKNVNDQQTHYYSMTMNSPTQLNMVGSKISEGKDYRSPFKTNQDNSRMDSQHQVMFNSNAHMTSIQKSSISQLTQYHIPRLEQKLKEHDQQLSTIKRYLKNTQQLNNLKESIHQYQQIQTIVQKQKQIQRKRQLLLLRIQQAKQKEKNQLNKHLEQADSKIKKIQEQRIKRLQKIQKENQRLYQNLKYHSHQQPQFQSNPCEDYHFQGPVAFPSKDWQSQRQIMIPMSDGFQRSYNSTNQCNRRQGSTTGQMQISPVLKKKMNQISLIGFSNNKTESFSMEANTFRQIMSPLQFQGQNQTW